MQRRNFRKCVSQCRLLGVHLGVDALGIFTGISTPCLETACRAGLSPWRRPRVGKLVPYEGQQKAQGFPNVLKKVHASVLPSFLLSYSNGMRERALRPPVQAVLFALPASSAHPLDRCWPLSLPAGSPDLESERRAPTGSRSARSLILQICAS